MERDDWYACWAFIYSLMILVGDDTLAIDKSILPLASELHDPHNLNAAAYPVISRYPRPTRLPLLFINSLSPSQ
jgi:hypothetical protein